MHPTQEVGNSRAGEKDTHCKGRAGEPPPASAPTSLPAADLPPLWPRAGEGRHRCRPIQRLRRPLPRQATPIPRAGAGHPNRLPSCLPLLLHPRAVARLSDSFASAWRHAQALIASQRRRRRTTVIAPPLMRQAAHPTPPAASGGPPWTPAPPTASPEPLRCLRTKDRHPRAVSAAGEAAQRC